MPEKTEAFAHSQTRENLMRAFAGESQAETATPSAAGIAHKSGLEVIQGCSCSPLTRRRPTPNSLPAAPRTWAGRPSGWTAPIRWTCTRPAGLSAGGPAQRVRGVGARLRQLRPHRMEEGFPLVGKLFENIANVEKIHGDRSAGTRTCWSRAGCLPATQRWSGCA